MEHMIRQLCTRKVIQLDDVNGTKFLKEPNDDSWDEHGDDGAGKKVGGISNRHNGRMLIDLLEFLTGVVQWQGDGNLKYVGK